MTKKKAEVKDRGLRTMTVTETAVHIFGVSLDTFNKNYRHAPLFMREVPDIGVNKTEYRRSDVERYFKLNRR
ncbi:hypothetical protein WOSG25_170120 [Weissella oryzae SG25]|uniref:DNA-binding protein n=1 Tax=Weissella oryzae (strain DSM 25784 / JCM 18191 / LMG 30913 / SG25) TaxID=1329250 RepID=A0A069CWL3_WEIOS|nr:hypothetical protein [Weissella oryzae]GAK31829.1 hypothetical protein WOSG25_170120 [Weissella oryzae SG25]